MAGVKGAKWSRGMTQHQRDAIALSKIELFLDNQLDTDGGLDAIEPTRLQAIKLRYDRLRPVLSAVEQTNHDGDQVLTEEQILAKMGQLIAEHPDLLQKAIAAHARGAAAHQAESLEQIKTGTEPEQLKTG